MQSGKPESLLAEEFVDLLRELGDLAEHAIAAQDMLENKNQAYALVWFLYNARTLKGDIIYIAFCLDAEQRPLPFFHRVAEREAPTTHVTLNDLRIKFNSFKEKVKRLELSYGEYLDIFFGATNKQLKLMEWNLDQTETAPV